MERKILVVDDEKNTRTTLEEALKPLGYEILLASSGEDALEHMADRGLGLVLLDLRMPGMGGLDVLRRFERDRPDVRVVILTAHGNVETAVESMKHGAADLIQKPLALAEIRNLVQIAMDPARQSTMRGNEYDRDVGDARRSIREDALDAALAQLRRATDLDYSRPEAHNLIGVVHELRHDRVTAQTHYRIALEFDRTYGPARDNLTKSMGDPAERGAPSLGERGAEAGKEAPE